MTFAPTARVLSLALALSLLLLARSAFCLTLRVGVLHNAEPFVMRSAADPNVLVGFDIDLLETILKLEPSIGHAVKDIQYTVYRSAAEMVRALLNSTKPGGIDMAMAGLSVNNDPGVMFSDPYFTSGLQILIRNLIQERSVFHAFTTAPLIQFIFCLFVIFLVMFAHCIWICERWSNKDFRPDYLEGVSDGFWWAAVTTGTVGYGDKTPKSPCGKTLTIMLMFWSMIMSSLLIAGVTSTLSTTIFVTGPTGPGSLSGMRLGLVRGRASSVYCHENVAADFVMFDALSDAVAGVLDGSIDAVVDDTARLIFHAQFVDILRVVGEMFNPHRLAFEFPAGSKLVPGFNTALKTIDGTGDLNILYTRWITGLNQELDRETKATVDPHWVKYVFMVASCIVITSILTCISQLCKRAFIDKQVKPSVPTREGAKTFMKDMISAGLGRPSATFDDLIRPTGVPLAGSAPVVTVAAQPRGDRDDVPLLELQPSSSYMPPPPRPGSAAPAQLEMTTWLAAGSDGDEEKARLRATVARLQGQVDSLSGARAMELMLEVE